MKSLENNWVGIRLVVDRHQNAARQLNVGSKLMIKDYLFVKITARWRVIIQTLSAVGERTM